MTYPWKEVQEKLEKHLSEISDEEFEQELIESGIEKCPYEIEFKNGSRIEGIKFENSIRSKGWFIGIDLAKEDSDYTVIECPQCYSINNFKSDIEHFNCLECGYKLF